MSAADNLYAELTRGVAHAQVRQHLIDAHRSEVLLEAAAAVDAGKMSFPENVRGGASWAGRMLRRMAEEEGEGTGTTGGEPTPAPRRTTAERRHWLLSVIISERGQWTVGRVKRLYGRYHEGAVLRTTIRHDLGALHTAGELVMHDGSDRRYYTLAPGGGR